MAESACTTAACDSCSTELFSDGGKCLNGKNGNIHYPHQGEKIGYNKEKYCAAVNTIRPISEHSITPMDVLESVLKHWEARPQEKRGKRVKYPSIASITTLIRFFFNVASPEALEECQNMCIAATRTNQCFRLERSVDETLAQLDRLEAGKDYVLTYIHS